MIKILFICHGNICRSTMAQFVMTDLVNKAGAADQFYIDSAATSTEEIGNPPHHGTVNKLRKEGIPVLSHRARQMTRRDYDDFDYIIGMDTWNLRNIQRIIRNDPENKVHLLLEFCNESADIPDPWYTGDFDATYRDVSRGCVALLETIRKDHRF